MLFRLILLLAIAGGIVLFTWSNFQSVPLTFLGIQTPAFPLALWVLAAIAAGILTTVCIRILFGLSNYATGREVRSRFRQTTRSRFEQLRRDRFQTGAAPASEATRSYAQSATPENDSDATWKNWEGFEEPADRQQTKKQTVTTDSSDDDWDLGSGGDWEEEPPNTPADRPSSTSSSNRTDREAKPEAKSTSQSGVYSYGYQDPGTTGVGKREKVVDAEYRVIIPPYNPPPPSYNPPSPPPYTPSTSTQADEEEENADDWFEDDDSSSDNERWQR